MVDMRADQLFVRKGHLKVFVFAVVGSFLRQMCLLHHVAKQLRIGAVGNAQQIVEALRGRAMRVGELLQCGRCGCGVHLNLVRVGGAPNQSARPNTGTCSISNIAWANSCRQVSNKGPTRASTAVTPAGVVSGGMAFQSWSIYS